MTLYTITPKGRKLLKGWIDFQHIHKLGLWYYDELIDQYDINDSTPDYAGTSSSVAL